MERKAAVVIAVVLACVLLLADDDGVDERRPCLQRQRLNWRRHSQLLLNEGQFTQYYRMSFRAFEKPLRLLAPSIRVDEAQSRRRTRGYSFHPVRSLPGASKSGFYGCIHQVMTAIENHDELQLTFPTTEFEQRQAARAFARLNNNRVLTGCVGVIDGWLRSMQVPRRGEVNRVVTFYSRHYQRYGVNVQACVDHRSRFIAVTSASPGGMGDASAFLRWEFSSTVQTFPIGLFLAGDNAYSNKIGIGIPTYSKILRQIASDICELRLIEWPLE